MKRLFVQSNARNDAGGKRKPLVPLLFISFAAVTALIFFFPAFPALRVTHQGNACLVLPLNKNEQFAVRYNHSVNRSPVIDTIESTGDGILTVRTSLFQTYGAGIPSLVDGVGTETVSTDDGLLLIGIDAPHDAISLITGTYADHHILYRGSEIQLKAIVGEKQLIVLTAAPASLFELIALHP